MVRGDVNVENNFEDTSIHFKLFMDILIFK